LCREVWAAFRQLTLEVQPLSHELTFVDVNELNWADRANLRSIECVPTSRRFAMDRDEVRIDRKARVGMRLEAIELGMIGIAACRAAKDGSCQQCLAPQSD
jgi:hypothetical protein